MEKGHCILSLALLSVFILCLVAMFIKTIFFELVNVLLTCGGSFMFVVLI